MKRTTNKYSLNGPSSYWQHYSLLISIFTEPSFLRPLHPHQSESLHLCPDRAQFRRLRLQVQVLIPNNQIRRAFLDLCQRRILLEILKLSWLRIRKEKGWCLLLKTSPLLWKARIRIVSNILEFMRLILRLRVHQTVFGEPFRSGSKNKCIKAGLVQISRVDGCNITNSCKCRTVVYVR